MKMATLRGRGADPWDVILGPCPGCLLWQVDYTDEVARSYAIMTMPGGREIQLGLDEWHEIVEDVLQEHFEECAHLRAIVQER